MATDQTRCSYQEAISTLYSLNTFHFHDRRRLVGFIAPLPVHRIGLLKMNLFVGLRAEVLWLNGSTAELDRWLDMWSYFDSHLPNLSSLTLHISAGSFCQFYSKHADHLDPMIRSSIPITLIFSIDLGQREKPDTMVDVHLVREQVLAKRFSGHHELGDAQVRAVRTALQATIREAVQALWS